MSSLVVRRASSLLKLRTICTQQSSCCYETPAQSRCLYTTPVNHLFFEKSKKDNYDRFTAEKTSKKKLILDGLKQLKEEIKMWQNEVKERILMDPVLLYRPGEVDVAFQFRKNTDFEKWVVTADSDNNEGFSTASLEKSPAGYGLFQGSVNAEIPKDGKVKRAGYCNIKSFRARKSFQRETYFDWSPYNTLGSAQHLFIFMRFVIKFFFIFK